MVKNDYTLLRKENRLRASCLDEKNQAILGRMSRYLESKGMNPYDNAVMQKELVSMALEAEMQGMPLEQVLGVPEHEFCDRLAEEGRHMTFADRIAFYLPLFMKVYAFVYFFQIPPGFVQGNLFHARTKISGGLLIAYAVWFLAYLYFGSGLWTGHGIYMKEGKQIVFLIGSAMVFIGGWILILTAAGKWIPTAYLEVPAILYILGWAALWLLSEWYQKKRAADLAADCPWMD